MIREEQYEEVSDEETEQPIARDYKTYKQSVTEAYREEQRFIEENYS
jgi:hypothetical protein